MDGDSGHTAEITKCFAIISLRLRRTLEELDGVL
jgi:hypothetical protein